ncbi:UbiX family flavin prenyltransferase [Candidatus Sumerlaeota bacterium]|nr:UbiX family flavin prenyltransferase [Candidatus Sumerlaeota bacterium]
MTQEGFDQIVVGISGASGARYGMRFVEKSVALGFHVHLIVTQSAFRVMQEEEGITGAGSSMPITKWLRVSEQQANSITLYNNRDIATRLASGTFRARAMVVIPASMKTVAAIAHGYTDDLLTRCADCFIKERRPLVIVPRETPLSAIHLQNMLTLAQVGAHVVPAMPGFYCDPRTVDDVVDFMVMKVFNLLNIPHGIAMAWDGPLRDRDAKGQRS